MSGSADKSLCVWNVTRLLNPSVRTLTGHSAAVAHVAWLGNETIVSASDDKTLRVWNASTGACLRTLTGHTRAVGTAHVVAKESRFNLGVVASAADDRTIRVWDVDTGRCQGMLTGHEGSVKALAVADSLVVTTCTLQCGLTRSYTN